MIKLSKNVSTLLSLAIAGLSALAALLFFVPVFKFTISFLATITIKLSECNLAFGKTLELMGYTEKINGVFPLVVFLLFPIISAVVAVLIPKHKLSGAISAALSVLHLILLFVAKAVIQSKLEDDFGIMQLQSSPAHILLVLVLLAIIGISVVRILSAEEDAASTGAAVPGTGAGAATISAGNFKDSMKKALDSAGSLAGEAVHAVKKTAAPAAAKPVKICTNCGTSLREEDVFCNICGTKYVAPPERRCQRCRNVMQEGDRFCRQCGFDTAAEATGTAAEEAVVAVSESDKDAAARAAVLAAMAASKAKQAAQPASISQDT